MDYSCQENMVGRARSRGSTKHFCATASSKVTRWKTTQGSRGWGGGQQTVIDLQARFKREKRKRGIRQLIQVVKCIWVRRETDNIKSLLMTKSFQSGGSFCLSPENRFHCATCSSYTFYKQLKESSVEKKGKGVLLLVGRNFCIIAWKGCTSKAINLNYWPVKTD